MAVLRALLLCAAVSLVAGRSLLQITPEQNYNPVYVTASSAPYDIIATPITPVAPYSQAAYQCNVTGDTRFPPYATGTYPLTVAVPIGQRVRVIFANGNLGDGSTVTQQGEPGVIIQQDGAVIVQQAGYASPIVQPLGSPVVQQGAPTVAYVVQQTPTIVQPTPEYKPAPPVPTYPPETPKPTETYPPETPHPTETYPPETPHPTETYPPETPPPTETPPPETPPPTKPPKKHHATPDPTKAPKWTPSSNWGDWSSWGDWNNWSGRRLQQDTVPGGPNNGLVEYVALSSANTVPGFVVPNTQFGVPYVEFTASAEAKGQTASFSGALESAQVVGGVPLYPFRPNKAQSPECQVTVNFVVQ